ncbi:recombinase family protein [Taibaiella helva]|uniref:recombinase family protein n=1 Tax=Taibaiella helva TaxID=2301235 RepID=UPI000E587BEA|nr:recombinase family protein [Taibaiella helva]
MKKLLNIAIGYRRISGKDQSKYSLAHQEEAIRNYCNQNGLLLSAIFTDNGESSGTFDRPNYKALERFMKKHTGKVQYLIVMSHDRFSRNLAEALMKIEDLQSSFQIKVLATNEDINIDVYDPLVFVQRAFSYLMANQELLQIRKRAKESIHYARLSGRYVNNAPFGYINGRDRHNKGILIVDEEKAEVIRIIYKWFLEGWSIKEIQYYARRNGLKNSGHSTIQRILSNCTYAGLIKISSQSGPAKYVRGIHQPIIRESDFWLAQEKKGSHKPSKSQPGELFPLRGVLKCWCGKSMTAGYSKGKKKYYPYYRCIEHTGTNIPADKLHAEFKELLHTFKLSNNQKEAIAAKAEFLLGKTLQDQKSIIEARLKQRADIERKLNNLDELLLEKQIDGATFDRLKSRLHEDIHVLDNSYHESVNMSQKWLELEKILFKTNTMRDVFEMATLANKHSLIRKLFRPQLVYTDGKFI